MKKFILGASIFVAFIGLSVGGYYIYEQKTNIVDFRNISYSYIFDDFRHRCLDIHLREGRNSVLVDYSCKCTGKEMAKYLSGNKIHKKDFETHAMKTLYACDERYRYQNMSYEELVDVGFKLCKSQHGTDKICKCWGHVFARKIKNYDNDAAIIRNFENIVKTATASCI